MGPPALYNVYTHIEWADLEYIFLCFPWHNAYSQNKLS